MDFKGKYLKYKLKYTQLKKIQNSYSQSGGVESIYDLTGKRFYCYSDEEGGNPFISLNNISADAADYKPICENNNYINIYRRDYGDKNWNKIDVLNSDYTPYNGVNNIFFDNNKDKIKRDTNFISNAKVINNNKPIIDNYLKAETQICAMPSVVKDNVTLFLNKLDKIYDEIYDEKID